MCVLLHAGDELLERRKLNIQATPKIDQKKALGIEVNHNRVMSSNLIEAKIQQLWAFHSDHLSQELER